MLTAHGPSGSHAQARRGHTLAELLVVLSLLTIVGAIAVPRFAGAGSAYNARGAAHQVADAIRFSANQARLRGATVGFRVSAATDNINAAVLSPLTYILIEDTDEPPFNASIDRVRFADTATRLEITPFGEYSTSLIVVLSAGSESAAVVLDAVARTVEVVSVPEAAEFEKDSRFQ